jgi:farnesol dehydrogenase
VRSTSRVEPLAALGVATFTGDVTDRASMREAMSGADVVVHAAADLDLSGPAERMEAINVGGSDNVASLAWKLGVPRFLSISSVAYFGGSPADGSPGNEDSKPQRPFPTRYSDTKHRGELAVRGYAERGLEVVTVYPSLIYGPPGKKEGANALLRQLWLGRFPVLIGADRKTSWIYLDDLVDGTVRALERAEPGSAYLLGGDIATIAEVARIVSGLGGAAPPEREISVRTATLLLRLVSPLYRLRGRRPPMPLSQLASLRRHWAFDDARARRELDWSWRPLAVGLEATASSLFRDSE